jgi:hypothetical protein
MKRRVVRILPVLLAAGGCYGYYPLATAAAPVGREVQLTLTDSGSFLLGRQIGSGVEAVSGRVNGDSAGAILLSVTSTRKRDGVEVGWKGERLAIQRALIAQASERRFSRARTALFGGALAVTLYALREAFGGPGYSSPGSGLPGGTGPK